MVFKAFDKLVFFISGKQPENPLLLLGQYSDDELDEESSKRLDHTTEENSIVDNNEQVISRLHIFAHSAVGEQGLFSMPYTTCEHGFMLHES